MAKESTKLAAAFDLVRFYPTGLETGSFRNHENQNVYYSVASPIGAQKGTVVLTPGYGDSVNFHYATISKWQERGFKVYSMDWIGQGLSDRENPERTNESNDRLLTRHMTDMHKFMTEIVGPKDPSKPLILSTHSMGGNIGAQYMKHYPNTFDGAVLGAPMLDLNTSFLPRSAFKAIISGVAKLGFGDHALPNWRDTLNRVNAATDSIHKLVKEPEQLSLSQEAQERMRVLLKPVEVDLPTWNFVRRAYHSMDEMRRTDYFDDIKTPTLLIAAGRDELVSNKAIKFAASELPHGHLLELPTAEHGVWNSNAVNDELLWKRIDTFLTREIAKPVTLPQPDIRIPHGEPLMAGRPGNENSRPAPEPVAGWRPGWQPAFG